eukprot:6480549-Amphidinium_carterae.1
MLGVTNIPQSAPHAWRKAEDAVLVRMHDPTSEALQRILQLASQLAGSDFDLWVSIDTTSFGNQPAIAFEEELRSMRSGSLAASPPVRVHEYDESRMLQLYPALAAMKRMMLQNLTWGFHVEAVNVWASEQAWCYRH